MNSDYWFHHFEQECARTAAPDWAQPPAYHGRAAAILARSLSHFQLGESGGGTFLLTQAKRTYPNDAGYAAALAGYVRAEQSHAMMLARAVGRLGRWTIHRHWTHGLFRLVRRSLGVRFEVQVFVIAELVGTAYYRLLRQHTIDPALREMCAIILDDEEGHLQFHGERVASEQAGWLPAEQALWAAQFQALLLGTAAVAWVDHRHALRMVGASQAEYWDIVRREGRAFLDSLVAPVAQIATP